MDASERREVRTRSTRFTLMALLFAATVAMFPNSVLFPASHDLSVHLHQAETFVGWMVTSYALAYVLATPLLGVISDYLGRQWVLVLGLLVFLVGGCVPLWTTQAWVVLSGRVVMGVGSAGIMPMVDSLIGDAYPQGPDRRRALAGFGAAVAVAEALAPFLGGAVDAWHWQGVFALYGLALPAALLCVFISPPPRRSAKDGRVNLRAYVDSLHVALRLPKLYAAIFGAIVYGVVYFGVCSLLPYAVGRPVQGLLGGTLFLPIGLAWVLFTAWLARLPHLVRVRQVLTLGALGLAGLTVWLAYAHAVWLILVIGVGWGAGSALLCTLFTWLVGDESPEMVRGAMNGIYNAAYMLGFSFGSPLFIFLMQRLGATAAFWCGALAMAGLAVFLRVVLPHRDAAIPLEPPAMGPAL
ncbi:MFS transporter [Alicyclobacillus cycloheptanicus]|nr:MFS transporter [Alicyclobacillus cycloheptanicus]